MQLAKDTSVARLRLPSDRCLLMDRRWKNQGEVGGHVGLSPKVRGSSKFAPAGEL